MSDRDQVAKRIFSYEEAAALLPEVRRITEDAYRRVEALAGGLAQGREAAQSSSGVDAIVTAWVSELTALGLEIKGLWLVDFDNGSGYYCWRYPEPGLHYYHSYEEGFRGRMRIQ